MVEKRENERRNMQPSDHCGMHCNLLTETEVQHNKKENFVGLIFFH